MKRKKPKLAVFKFTSCDGCQLSLLNCEDELLDIANKLDIAYFPEASRAVIKGPYDLCLVEGSMSTNSNLQEIHEVRKNCKFLVTIGACATSGGIQALRNFKDVKDFLKVVYAKPEYIDTLTTSTPISEHVQVDYELRGCPINKNALLELISAFIGNRKPNIPTYSVCMECKLKGNVCVMVSRNIPCLGPVTHAGCNALCPTYNRGCYGCYGPMESPNAKSLMSKLSSALSLNEVKLAFQGYNVNAGPFKKIITQ
jgi:coenzyme F420-reducing hydrogenase gamma subunit